MTVGLGLTDATPLAIAAGPAVATVNPALPARRAPSRPSALEFQ